MSQHDLIATGPGEAPTTGRPVPTVIVRRNLNTVVVSIGGVLDQDGLSAVSTLLWDLVAGQGNLSVAVDARHLTSCAPAVTELCAVLEGEAARRGGTLTVVEPSLPRPSTDRDREAASLDLQRARRAARLGMADHPAGGARKMHRTPRGA